MLLSIYEEWQKKREHLSEIIARKMGTTDAGLCSLEEPNYLHSFFPLKRIKKLLVLQCECESEARDIRVLCE